jgi:TRAP-type C4-dicarboxylate transport system permease small subunit
MNRIEHAMIVVAVLATGMMMLLTSTDAIMRYTLNKPILGAYEITEKYLMVAAIFLGFTYAYRGGAFIRVTFMVDMLPAPFKAMANWFAYLVSVGCCGLLLYATGLQATQSLGDATTMATLPILIGPAQIVAPVGFLGLLILLLVDAKRVSSGEALLFSQENPTDKS